MRDATERQDRGQEGVSVQEPLTREEDDELRRLNFLAQTGTLSERSKARVVQLRVRDRRRKIRPPREFESLTEEEKAAGPWSRFLRRN